MTVDLFGLAGKNVLVVGGGQGMGESTSMYLARAGCNVAVFDIDRARAERVAARVTGEGRRGLSYAVDVTDDAAVVSAITKAESDLGGFDGMASIVGMAAWARLLDMTPDMWDLDQRRNLRYFFLAARTVAAAMIAKKRTGGIVCVTSIDGVQSSPYHAAYGAAKAGLINLVRSMAAEWTPLGVRVNAIAAGAIVTPRIPLFPPEEEQAKTKSIPARRRGTTDEIGKAALFLLSDLAAYVTGQTLAVDGGFTSVGMLDYEAELKKVKTGGTMGLSPKP